MRTKDTLITTLKSNWPYFLVLIPMLAAWICDRHVPSNMRSTVTNIISGLLTLTLVMIVQTQRGKLEGISITDKLTGVFNARYLRLELDRQVLLSHRTQLPLSLIFLDVDNLKSLNDQYGHMVGNSILRQLGQCLITKIRQHVDICFRFGGDEFIVLCPNSDLKIAHGVAERIRDGCMVNKITLSVGVIRLQEDESPENFLKRADRVMYSVKQAGKDGIAFDPQDNLARSKVCV